MRQGSKLIQMQQNVSHVNQVTHQKSERHHVIRKRKLLVKTLTMAQQTHTEIRAKIKNNHQVGAAGKTLMTLNQMKCAAHARI